MGSFLPNGTSGGVRERAVSDVQARQNVMKVLGREKADRVVTTRRETSEVEDLWLRLLNRDSRK